MQETKVWSLAWEDPTCDGVTKPVFHNYWASIVEPTLQLPSPLLQLLKPVRPRACTLQQEKTVQCEAHAPHSSAPQSLALEKRTCSNEEPAQPRNNNFIFLKEIIDLIHTQFQWLLWTRDWHWLSNVTLQWWPNFHPWVISTSLSTFPTPPRCPMCVCVLSLSRDSLWPHGL